MITVTTGLPGSFKTTAMLREAAVGEWRDRPLVMCGFKGLNLGREVREVTAEEVQHWQQFPQGSVVMIDEAQAVFPLRGMNSKPPKWIEDLSIHRHGGYDFVLITQDASFIDTVPRKLAGRHWHYARRFGMERANVFSWEEVSDPKSVTAKAFAVQTTFVPKPEDYERHKSATIHTHKRRLPWGKLLTIGIASAVVVVALVLVLRHLLGGAGVVGAGGDTGVTARARAQAAVDGARNGGGGRIWEASARSPRGDYPDRPESAPIYDALQEVKSQPRLLGCADYGVSLGGRAPCVCVSTQRVVMESVSSHECRRLIRQGWFDETRDEPDWQAIHIARLNASSSAAQSAAAPSGGAGTDSVGSGPVPPVVGGSP